MKNQFLLLLLSLIPLVNIAQSIDHNPQKGLGFALNTTFNGELFALQVTPSLLYNKGNNQFELGIGFNPIDRADHTLLSGELSYKYFPNGTAHKFNMYLLTRISLIHNERNTFYPATYNYLFLDGGYGFQIKLFEGAYMGTDVSIGTFSYHKNSQHPYEAFATNNFLDEVGFCLDFGFQIGYRF